MKFKEEQFQYGSDTNYQKKNIQFILCQLSVCLGQLDRNDSKQRLKLWGFPLTDEVFPKLGFEGI